MQNYKQFLTGFLAAIAMVLMLTTAYFFTKNTEKICSPYTGECWIEINLPFEKVQRISNDNSN